MPPAEGEELATAFLKGPHDGGHGYAEGDQLHFDFTVTSLPETTEEERTLYADVLKGPMESAGTTFNAVASQVKDSVSNEVVEVVISYLDGAGNVIYSVTYSSADAVA